MRRTIPAPAFRTLDPIPSHGTFVSRMSRRSALDAKLPSKDEARRIAANIVKLPEPPGISKSKIRKRQR
jgi:hypothetical protein